MRRPVPLKQGPRPGDAARQPFDLVVAGQGPLGHEGLAQGRVGDDGEGLADQGPQVQVHDVGRARLGAVWKVRLPVEGEEAQGEVGGGVGVGVVGAADGEQEGEMA